MGSKECGGVLALGGQREEAGSAGCARSSQMDRRPQNIQHGWDEGGTDRWEGDGTAVLGDGTPEQADGMHGLLG